VRGFAPWRPRKKSLDLLKHVKVIIAEYEMEAGVKDRSSGVSLDTGRARKPLCAAGFCAICRSLGEGSSLLPGAPANVRYLG
jgi:hypothetical protein